MTRDGLVSAILAALLAPPPAAYRVRPSPLLTLCHCCRGGSSSGSSPRFSCEVSERSVSRMTCDIDHHETRRDNG